jgi:hypothetical protein
MPTLNPADLQPEIAEILAILIERHASPLELAVAVWNASYEYGQGDRDVTND